MDILQIPSDASVITTRKYNTKFYEELFGQILFQRQSPRFPPDVSDGHCLATCLCSTSHLRCSKKSGRKRVNLIFSRTWGNARGNFRKRYRMPIVKIVLDKECKSRTFKWVFRFINRLQLKVGNAQDTRRPDKTGKWWEIARKSRSGVTSGNVYKTKICSGEYFISGSLRQAIQAGYFRMKPVLTKFFPRVY